MFPKDNKSKRTYRDLVVVWVVTIITYVMAFSFDLYERFVAWIDALENWGGNQAVLPTFVFSICIAWFAYRRWADSEGEANKLRLAEEALRFRVMELETLRRASLQLTASLSLEDVLVAILDYARQLVQADDAHIFSFDGQQLHFEIAYWNGRYQKKPIAQPRPNGLTYTIALEKTRVVVPRVDNHPLFNDWPWGGAIVGLPLCIGENVRGVMSMSYAEPHEFTDNELRILALLADQAAIAMQNASLHEQVQQQAADLEQHVAARTAELVAANEELSQYAYAVAHDLRTPLRGVRHYADFLYEDLEATLDGEQRRYIHGLTHAVNHAEDLVEGLLRLSQVGVRDAPKVQIRVGEFLQELIVGMALPTEIKIQLADRWPVIYTEKTLFRQVFQNLIANAIKFNQSSHKEIILDWRQEQDDYLFWVQDNGIGIELRYQEQIFGLFERLHPQQAYEGTGIGLALVHKAVRILGGSITVDSTEGEGSTFYVRLPA